MIAQAKACTQCNQQVKAPIPNFELMDQMQAFSTTMAAQMKQYQEKEKATDEKLAKAGSKLAGLKLQMVANKEKIVAGTASELVAKAQELVDLGLFDDIEQAKSELIAKMNVPAQSQSTAPKEKLTKAELIDENKRGKEDDIALYNKNRALLTNVKTKYSDGELKFHPLPTLARFLDIPPADTKISCVICLESYAEIGEHQPYAFDCGHGACGSCIAQIQKNSVACHVCRAEIKAPRPNYVLIEQIAQAANKMTELAVAHKDTMGSKEEALSKAEAQASAIKEKLEKYATSSAPTSTSTSTTTSTSVVNTYDCDSSEDFVSDEEEIDLSALPPVPTLSSYSTTGRGRTTIGHFLGEDDDDGQGITLSGMLHRIMEPRNNNT